MQIFTRLWRARRRDKRRTITRREKDNGDNWGNPGRRGGEVRRRLVSFSEQLLWGGENILVHTTYTYKITGSSPRFPSFLLKQSKWWRETKKKSVKKHFIRQPNDSRGSRCNNSGWSTTIFISNNPPVCGSPNRNAVRLPLRQIFPPRIVNI